ncbi:MAG: hypothetical protein Q7R63_01830, partial [bacterium]|nr:hypothetical protein [bacterium]
MSDHGHKQKAKELPFKDLFTGLVGILVRTKGSDSVVGDLTTVLENLGLEKDAAAKLAIGELISELAAKGVADFHPSNSDVGRLAALERALG